MKSFLIELKNSKRKSSEMKRERESERGGEGGERERESRWMGRWGRRASEASEVNRAQAEIEKPTRSENVGASGRATRMHPLACARALACSFARILHSSSETRQCDRSSSVLSGLSLPVYSGIAGQR